MKELEEEKQKIQNALELSRYLCEKQLVDLKTTKQDISGLQKTMVRNYARLMELILMRIQECDPFVLFLVDGDITKVRSKTMSMSCILTTPSNSFQMIISREELLVVTMRLAT